MGIDILFVFIQPFSCKNHKNCTIGQELMSTNASQAPNTAQGLHWFSMGRPKTTKSISIGVALKVSGFFYNKLLILHYWTKSNRFFILAMYECHH